MNNNKNNFFIAVSVALIGALAHYFLFEDKIYDVRAVYSIQERDLDSTQSEWGTVHFNEPDFRAYIFPRFSSVYNQLPDEVYHFELVIRTDNATKLDQIQQKYLEQQPMDFFSQKPQFFKTTIIRASKPWNATMGIFILVLLVAYGLLQLLKLPGLQNKE